MPETEVMFLSDLRHPEKTLVSWERLTSVCWLPKGQDLLVSQPLLCRILVVLSP